MVHRSGENEYLISVKKFLLAALRIFSLPIGFMGVAYDNLGMGIDRRHSYKKRLDILCIFSYKHGGCANL